MLLLDVLSLKYLLPNYLLFRQWHVLANDEKNHRIQRKQHSESEFEYFTRTELRKIRKLIGNEVTNVLSSDYPDQEIFEDRFEKGAIFFTVCQNLKKISCIAPTYREQIFK